MTQIKNGGPAFPCPELRLSDGTGVVAACDGMSMRDWFAGQALSGILSYPEAHLVAGTAEMAAKSAYQIADAMLAAREAKRDGPSQLNVDALGRIQP